MAFKLRSNYVSSYYGVPGEGWDFVFQPVIPFQAWGLNNILRSTITYEQSGPGEQALKNVNIFDLIVFNEKWGRWGFGPLVSFSPYQGPNRDTATFGPAVGFVAAKGKWNIGLFNQNLFGEATKFSSIQPILVYNLGEGWTISTGDAQFSRDWRTSTWVNLPLGAQLAKVAQVGKQPVQFFVNPEYNASNVFGAPHWTVRFGMAILAPAGN